MPSAAPRSPTESTAPAAPDWLAPDHHLGFALLAASLAMSKPCKSLLAPLGLACPQHLAMLVPRQQDGITVQQVGERLALDSGTLRPPLERLQAAGMVHRVRDEADERRVRLQPTPAGRELRHSAAEVPTTIAGSTGCSLGEITVLTRQLQQIRSQMTSTTPARPVAA